MANFSELSLESRAILESHVAFWSIFSEGLNLTLSIDHTFEVDQEGCGMYSAQYAIVYAVLLDDKKLTQELCDLGANLNVIDHVNGRKTPLEIAIEYGRADIADILMKRGARTPKVVKIPSSNFCSDPFTFFYCLQEKARNRQVDYGKIEQLVSSINTV